MEKRPFRQVWPTLVYGTLGPSFDFAAAGNILIVGPAVQIAALVLRPLAAPTQPPAQAPTGVTIPYPGRLSLASPRDASQTDAAGQPVPDGTYDFTFTLYDTETGGALLWSEAQAGVPVQAGAFNVLLGAGQPIPLAALNGGDRWLEVAVRGPGEAAFTALVPRQRLTAAAPAAPDSASAGLACPHDHLGEVWTANIGWSNAGLRINNSANGTAL